MLDSGSFARPVAVSRVVELRQLCDAGQHPAIAARGIAARGCVRVSVLARQRFAGVGDILRKTTCRDVSEFHVHACRAGAQPYRVLRAKRVAVGSLTAAPLVCALAQRWRRTAREEQAVREVRWQHVKQRHHVLLAPRRPSRTSRNPCIASSRAHGKCHHRRALEHFWTLRGFRFGQSSGSSEQPSDLCFGCSGFHSTLYFRRLFTQPCTETRVGTNFAGIILEGPRVRGVDFTAGLQSRHIFKIRGTYAR